MAARARLLAPAELIRTGPVDHADWNYRFVLGWLQRRRFSLVRSLLPSAPVDRLLEVGYGSGVFMPELSRHCRELHGADVHEYSLEVTERLAAAGVAAQLIRASAAALPHADGYFDCLVGVSSLEFIDDIDAAALELRRVLRPGGRLVFVSPASSPLLDAALRMWTGASARDDYAQRRERLVPALAKQFALERQRCFPPLISGAAPIYRAYHMR